MLRLIVILFLGNLLLNAQNVKNNRHQEKFQGRVQSIKTLQFDNENDLITQFLTTYNEKGDLIKKITYDNDGNPFWVYEYQYDDKGKLLTHTDYGAASEVKKRYDYVYDDKGNLISAIQKGCNNRTDYFYDDENHLIKREIYLIGSLNALIETEYTQQGSVDTYYTESREKNMKFTYDKNNNLLERIYYFNNQRKVFKYDDFGNEVQWLIFDDKNTEPQKYQFIYNFDSQNNWIKRRVYINDELSQTVERNITYFK